MCHWDMSKTRLSKHEKTSVLSPKKNQRGDTFLFEDS